MRRFASLVGKGAPALVLVLILGSSAKAGVSITSPVDGSTVRGIVTIAVSAEPKPHQVDAFIDSDLLQSRTSPPYTFLWNSTGVADGSHTIGVQAFYDRKQRRSATDTITVIVANVQGTPTPLPTSTPTPTPSGVTFYVSPTGNDSNEGSFERPWRTIQHAASALAAGETAIVAASSYNERVSITSSGTSTAPITLEAAGNADVRMLGFNLSGSYWTLKGFDISTQTNGTNGYGIYVSGAASSDTLEGNYIHELCHEGIFLTPTVTQIRVNNNSIWRAEMAGINVNGTYGVIAGNEVWDTQQEPVAAGGIYSSCVTPSGADADGLRFFGQHNVIRSNYLHDIHYGTPVNPNPHIDCFQTWGSSAMTVDDILIERNLCRWPSGNPGLADEAGMIEGLNGRIGTVTLQNNVLADMQQGINVGAKVAALHVLNNTWDHILQEAVIFKDTRSSADEIINNIFYDVGSGSDSYICITGSAAIIATNDFYMPGGGRLGTYCSSAPYISMDPKFVNYGDYTGAGADYHLQNGSLIADNGTTLDGSTVLNGVTLPRVANDYDGTARPLGAGYSIGAFER